MLITKFKLFYAKRTRLELTTRRVYCPHDCCCVSMKKKKKMETIFELLKLKHDYYTICKSFTIECVFKLERVIVILLETIRYVLLDLGPCLLPAMGIILVPMIFDFKLYFSIPF